MSVVLCYGDSNTWGYEAASHDRLSRTARWTGVLASELGANAQVIEEGLGGRTTVWDDPIEGDKNGKTYLPPCLASHKPIDVVVLMLGTNDLKKRFSLSAFDVAEGAATLTRIILASGTGKGTRSPKVLLVAPARITELPTPDIAAMFEGAVEKSAQFPVQFQRVATLLGVEFLDAATIVTGDPLDGIHLSADAHQKLGKAVAERVRTMTPG